MRTISYQTHFDFGKGVGSIGELACGQAVEIASAETIQGAGGQAIQFRLDIVESQEHFQKVLGLSTSASLRYGIPALAGAGGNAKFTLLRRTPSTSTTSTFSRGCGFRTQSSC